MKRLSWLSCAVAVLLASPAAAQPSSGSRRALVFGSDDDFPPYEWLDANGVPQGFNVELIRAVGDAAGYDVEVRLGPWPAIRAELEERGTIDVSDMYYSEERAELFDFAAPFAIAYDQIFVRRGSPSPCRLEALSGKRVLVQRASFTEEFVRRLESGADVIAVDSEPAALVRLSGGEGDCAIVTEQTGRYVLQTRALENLVGVGPPINPRPHAFVVAKGQTEFVADLNRGLRQVRASGRYEQIHRRWLGPQDGAGGALRAIAWTAGALAALLLVASGWSWALRRQVRRRTRELDGELERRRLAEVALRESEERFRTLVEAAPEAIVVIDSETGRFTSANANALSFFGLSREALPSRGTLDVSAEDASASSWARHMDSAMRGEAAAFDWAFVDSAGERAACEVRLVRLPASDRRELRASIIDVRARRRLEEQLELASRMESVGRLAGGIAHDFNNLLTVILSVGAHLRSHAADEEVAAELDDLLVAGRRAAALTRQLLAFSSRQVLQPQLVDLNELVRELEKMLRRILGEDVQLVIELDPALRLVRADRAQLEQVVVNLAVNARDAMLEGGRLTIRTRAAAADADGGTPEERTVLEVVDTGAGMSPDVLARIFEPFFTTKELGRGTGLGLATVYGIVKQSGGRLDVGSEPGRGSRFTVILPSERAEKSSAAVHVAPLAGAGTEAILVVEDEPALRRLMAQTLGERGYEVASAADAAEALAVCDTREEPFALLVTDVVMPGMRGNVLAEHLRERMPALRTLFVTGYAEDEGLRSGATGARGALLSKPFDMDELARRVRSLLDAKLGDAPAPVAG